MINSQSGNTILPELRYGLWGIIIGFTGIFSFSILFSPLAFILGTIGLVKGQIVTGITAILFALLGAITSPIIWGLIGAGVLIFFPEFILWDWHIEHPKHQFESI